jgi:hypothetical protein
MAMETMAMACSKLRKDDTQIWKANNFFFFNLSMGTPARPCAHRTTPCGAYVAPARPLLRTCARKTGYLRVRSHHTRPPARPLRVLVPARPCARVGICQLRRALGSPAPRTLGYLGVTCATHSRVSRVSRVTCAAHARVSRGHLRRAPGISGHLRVLVRPLGTGSPAPRTLVSRPVT